MNLLLVSAVVLCGLVVLALVWPVRLSVSGQAHGEPDGAWAAAAGAQFGPLAIAMLSARKISPIVTVHVFGREVMRKRLEAPDKSGGAVEVSRQDELQAELEPDSRGEREFWLWRRFKQRLDWIELVAQLLTERRRVRIGTLDIDLGYSFHDVALTGKVVGALCVLSAILPRRIHVRHRPRWEFVDRWDFSADGYVRLRVGLLVCDALWYMLKVSMRGRSVPEGATHTP